MTSLAGDDWSPATLILPRTVDAEIARTDIRLPVWAQIATLVVLPVEPVTLVATKACEGRTTMRQTKLECITRPDVDLGLVCCP
jgi:hypothetical protein